jgi:ribonuclease P protein component
MRTGSRRRLRYLEVIWRESETGHARLGLLVPRFQSTVVARNRLRRRLRELWRRELLPEHPPWDVVLKARPEAYRASSAELRQDLVDWREVAWP